MSVQKDRITKRLEKAGAAWAVRSDKFCDPNDPLENCAAGRRTYHIHPDAEHPHWNSVERFDSLKAIELWLNETEAIQGPFMRADRWHTTSTSTDVIRSSRRWPVLSSSTQDTSCSNAQGAGE